jgi:hypothetical protein
MLGNFGSVPPVYSPNPTGIPLASGIALLRGTSGHKTMVGK